MCDDMREAMQRVLLAQAAMLLDLMNCAEYTHDNGIVSVSVVRSGVETELPAEASPWINIPAALALIKVKSPGFRVIYRDAFRWKDEQGHVLPNHYESFGAQQLAAENDYELVLDAGYAAILVDNRATPDA